MSDLLVLATGLIAPFLIGVFVGMVIGYLSKR